MEERDSKTSEFYTIAVLISGRPIFMKTYIMKASGKCLLLLELSKIRNTLKSLLCILLLTAMVLYIILNNSFVSLSVQLYAANNNSTGILVTRNINSNNVNSVSESENGSKIPSRSTLDVRCVEFRLKASRIGNGMGNILFETISMLGISAQLGRIPYIGDIRSMKNVMAKLQSFPTLLKHLENIQKGASKCQKPTENYDFAKKCCTFVNISSKMMNSKSKTIKIDAAYLQSFKYFKSLETNLTSLLQPDTDTISIAKNDLFPGISNQSLPRICVHIRRGDFVRFPYAFASRADFTRASIEYIRANSTHNVYVMNNDHKWSENSLAGLSNIYYAKTNPKWPPNVEWEFSRLFCDKVILTAASSTYGWWMGFLSKGQQVFYNKKYSKPGGIENELNPADFFPHHWKEIDLQANGTTVMTA